MKTLLFSFRVFATLICIVSFSSFQTLSAQNSHEPTNHFTVPEVAGDYCIPFSDCSVFQITAFELADISNAFSGCSPDGYGDFTEISTELYPDAWYDVFYISAADDHYFSVWIDFNNDEIFDADELVIDDFYQETDNDATIPIYIPGDVLPGIHRLRARLHAGTSASDPCSDFDFGETEDYEIVIFNENDYCIPFTDCSYGDGLESFVIADIENYSSGCSEYGYGDYTSLITNLNAGQSYTLFAETGYDDNYMSVWIDFNDDFNFDPDEILVEDFHLENGGYLYEMEVLIPDDANPGTHRLRARALWDQSSADPCLEDADGETEDYTVVITQNIGTFDIGIVSIDIPEVISPGLVVPKVTLQNFGTETFTQQLSIINSVDYGTSAFVEDMLPGEIRQVTFAEWDAQIGTYTFHAYLSFGDDNSANDQFFKEVLVEIPDVNPPQNLNAQVDGSTVELNWEAPETEALIGYRVYNNGIRVACNITETTFTDLCLTNGVFTYSVTAVYEIGESLPCPSLDVTIEYDGIVLRNEGFENFTSGQQLVMQAQSQGISYWNCWINSAGSQEDPTISNEEVFEGDNSMLIHDLNDVMLDLGGKTQGKYSVFFNFFVPTGYDGFFGVWREVSSSSGGLEAYFNEDGTGLAIVANSEWQPLSFEPDTWLSVEAIIDLDNDWGKFYLNNTMICQAQWSIGQSGEPGPLKLDIINFYAGTIYGGTPKSFVDNISFKRIIDSPFQTIHVPAGWSGISSFLIPESPNVEDVLFDVIDELIVITNDEMMYWPDENINTIGNWDCHEGYFIKTNKEMPLTIWGLEETNKSINLSVGWNIIPVLSSCPVGVETLFASLEVEMVKELVGLDLFWPAQNINTLNVLQPGKAYLVKMNESGVIEFPECSE